jgi:hypothetical protein
VNKGGESRDDSPYGYHGTDRSGDLFWSKSGEM